MNPPTAPSPRPALTSPVRLIVRMAPASLSEELPGGSRRTRTHRIHDVIPSIPPERKERATFRHTPDTARSAGGTGEAPVGVSGLVVLGVSLQETRLQDGPFARSE
ncbi:hypothetical protein GCM10023086_24930 [Streptomyces venetus]|uniref:Uncharacterized protein n=1 Tax=Streptomyces venetus TaxID=1701086 RepID=A0ABP8FLJ4_9ACTN